MLRRQREKQGLPVSVEKFFDLLSAVAPGESFVPQPQMR
jgi:hypothetical protein